MLEVVYFESYFPTFLLEISVSLLAMTMEMIQMRMQLSSTSLQKV